MGLPHQTLSMEAVVTSASNTTFHPPPVIVTESPFVEHFSQLTSISAAVGVSEVHHSVLTKRHQDQSPDAESPLFTMKELMRDDMMDAETMHEDGGGGDDWDSGI